MTHCVARNTAGKMSKLQPKLAVSCLAAVSHKINVSMVCRNVQSQHFILCYCWLGWFSDNQSQSTDEESAHFSLRIHFSQIDYRLNHYRSKIPYVWEDRWRTPLRPRWDKQDWSTNESWRTMSERKKEDAYVLGSADEVTEQSRSELSWFPQGHWSPLCPRTHTV